MENNPNYINWPLIFSSKKSYKIASDQLRDSDHILREQSEQKLVLHGQCDADIPIETQEHYVQQSVGTNNDLTFFKYPFINHTVSDQMIADIFIWLDERF